ncbi:hypothetical protein ACTMTF_42215 [Nonomuraea sp. ZG12]|uniref:hypothetical protein n=1 Tax=Nonomuraea sp. ZG12 TaxID=3452207 RepID=UPI003F89A235
MRKTSTSASAVMLLLVTVAACGGQEPTVARATPAPAASAPTAAASPRAHELRKSDIPWHGTGDPYNATVELDDGRRVAMHYRRGKGLYEQHSSLRAAGWTKPRLIYGTKTEACQGIHLRAFGGTVTAVADFGVYCSDGEPPMESVAAVGVGGLRTWDHHLTRSFDGWERVSASDGGKEVTFRRGSATLRWSRSGGFSN